MAFGIVEKAGSIFVKTHCYCSYMKYSYRSRMRDIFIGEWELRKHEGEPVKRVTFTKHLPYTTPPTHKAQAAELPGRRGAGMQNSVSCDCGRTAQGKLSAAHRPPQTKRLQKRRTIFPAMSERRSENGCILSFRRRLEASFPHKKSTSSKRRNAFVVPLFFKTLSGLLKTLNACHTSPATHSSYSRQSRFPDFPQPLHPGSFRTHFKNLLVRLLSPADSRSLETGADFLLFPFSAFSCSL